MPIVKKPTTKKALDTSTKSKSAAKKKSVTKSAPKSPNKQDTAARKSNAPRKASTGTAKKISTPKKKTSAHTTISTSERDPEREKYLMGWQRKMDPSNFNKSRGAQYHTAPTVVMPGDMGYPEDLPKESVTFLFRITDEGWIGEPEKMVVDMPLVIEKEPRKGAKNGPVFVLSATAALCSIAYKENYYWSANVLSKHQVLRMKFVPEKKRTDGKKRNIVVYATFMPNEDE